MDNLQLFRFVANLEQRLKVIENTGNNTNSGNTNIDFSDVLQRLAAVEARPELSQRLSALELAVTSQNNP